MFKKISDFKRLKENNLKNHPHFNKNIKTFKY